MKATVTDYPAITDAHYVAGHRRRLKFNEGSVRVVDFGPFLAKARNPDPTDHRDIGRFKRCRIESGDLVWGDYQMVFPIIDLYRGEI